MTDGDAIATGKLTEGLAELLSPVTKERLAKLKQEEIQFQKDLIGEL